MKTFTRVGGKNILQQSYLFLQVRWTQEYKATYRSTHDYTKQNPSIWLDDCNSVHCVVFCSHLLFEVVGKFIALFDIIQVGQVLSVNGC